MNKYEQLNYKVTRKRNAKEIDMTYQDFDVVWKALDKINDDRLLKKKTSMQEMLSTLKDRTVATRIVRMSSPIVKFDRGKKIQSPMGGPKKTAENEEIP